MRKTTIAGILISTCLCTTLYANKLLFKGMVVDLYGALLKEISIKVKDESNLYPDNRFAIQVNKGDTLKFELEGISVKDTILTDTTKLHLIRVKPQMVETGEELYESSSVRFQDKRFSPENFIDLNLQYPADALKDSLSGVAHVRFKVNANGEKYGFYVRPSLSPSLDQEAIRLVRSMPGVIPVLQGNHYVSLYSFVPVRFNVRSYLYQRTDEEKSVSSNPNGFDRKHIYEKTEFKPEFPGGSIKMKDFISKSLVYPTDVEKGEVANAVDLKFVVDSMGTITNLSVYRGITPSLNNAAIQMVNKMPKWTPATIQGKRVTARVNLSVSFSLNKKYPFTKSAFDSIDHKRNDPGAFVIVEEMPEFPGGIGPMMSFLSSNVKYPVEEQKKGITGMEIVSFVVNNTGKIEDITVVRSVGASFDEEAIRIIQKMPCWKPGRQGGNYVSVKFTLPIRFALK